MTDPILTIIWRSLENPGSEYCSMAEIERGYLIEGTVHQAISRTPYQAHYQIFCDHAWQTRTVQIEILSGIERRTLHLQVDQEQRWWASRRELRLLRGCLDVDLGITPSTNTLPIRRLGLKAGESAEVTAAWVQFPGLEIQPLPQRYSRLDDIRYLYESGNGRYENVLEVDIYGLVVHYPNAWVREAVSQTPVENG